MVAVTMILLLTTLFDNVAVKEMMKIIMIFRMVIKVRIMMMMMMMIAI